MKTISLISLFALVAMVATPKAQANDKTGAIVGGILGGIIIGSIIADDDDCSSASYSVGIGYDTGYGVYGHWEWTNVRTWVPGFYERRYDRCGNHYRAWIPGHYSFVRQKVWISEPHPRHYRYERHDGYDRRDYYDRHDSRRNDYRDSRHDNDRHHEERATHRF